MVRPHGDNGTLWFVQMIYGNITGKDGNITNHNPWVNDSIVVMYWAWMGNGLSNFGATRGWSNYGEMTGK